MGKVRVTIKYLGARTGHSRYGYVQREEMVVRFVEESELDDVIRQFRQEYGTIEAIAA